MAKPDAPKSYVIRALQLSDSGYLHQVKGGKGPKKSKRQDEEYNITDLNNDYNMSDSIYLTVCSLKHEETRGLIKVSIDYDEKAIKKIFETFIYQEDDKHRIGEDGRMI